ncbi:MAG: hypothetical protein ACR2MC_09380 [Actinomycetota bacterium]
MTSMLKRHGYLAPFPKLPASANGETGLDSLWLRPFGLFHADLELDFDQETRPQLVTQILQCCTTSKAGDPPDERFLWNLTSSKRIECLVAIASLRSPSGLTVRLRCPDETCLQEMELDLSLAELAGIQRQAEATDRCLIRLGDRSLQIRKPTGRDQLSWSNVSFEDEGAAAQTVIQTLLSEEVSAEVNDLGEWVRAIDSAMEELDPLVDFAMLVSCPGCGTENRHRVDLQELSLGLLRQDQLVLLEAVHRLVLRYHWSEEQIFSLPPWRFSRYLALIERVP